MLSFTELDKSLFSVSKPPDIVKIVKQTPKSLDEKVSQLKTTLHGVFVDDVKPVRMVQFHIFITYSQSDFHP